jgi:hypothetical protein
MADRVLGGTDMKTLALSACAALAALAAPGPESVRWAPESGTSLKRVFEAHHKLELSAATLTVDGQEIEGEELPEWRIDYSERVAVTDRIGELGQGVPLELERTFDELWTEVQHAGEAFEEQESSRSSSPLEGVTVRFLWDEEEERHDVESEEELDAELLGGLVEDMDLRAFLPADEVEEGDTWEAGSRAFLDYMWPGGLLGFRDDEEPDELDAELNQALYDNAEGTTRVTFDGLRTEDDRRLAVLRLEIEVQAEAGLEVEEPMPGTQTFRLEREVAGELLWDLEAGRLHSLSVEGDGRETYRYEVSGEDEEGVEHELVEQREFEGSVSYSASVEDA